MVDIFHRILSTICLPFLGLSLITILWNFKVRRQYIWDMEVELLWRRPNAPSVALCGGLRLLRLAEFVRHNRAAIGEASKWQPMNSLVSSCLGSTCYYAQTSLHVIGGASKQQPMNSLVSSCLGSMQTPKVIKLVFKNKIREN